MGAIVARNIYHADMAHEVVVPIPPGDPSTWPARWWEGPGRPVRHDSADLGEGPDLTHFDASGRTEYDADQARRRMIARMNRDSRSYVGITRANVREHAMDGLNHGLAGIRQE
jgi:hypothetical protein